MPKPAEKTNTPSSVPPLQFTLRAKQGWHFLDEKFKPHQEYIMTNDISESICRYSNDGSLLAIVNPPNIEIWDATTMTLRSRLEHQNVRNFAFSPNSKYLISYNFRKKKEDLGNVKVWNLETDQIIARQMMPQKVQFDPKHPPILWDKKGFYSWKISNKQSLQLCKADDPSKIVFLKPWKKLQQISPSVNKMDVLLATFTGGTPSMLALWHVFPDKEGEDRMKRLANKAQMNAEEVEFLWNKKGDAVLCVTECAVDKTNQSYYGVKGLLLMDRYGTSWRVPISGEAPLQDAQWHPDGNRFVVIDGYPLRATMLNCDGKGKTWEIQRSSCNTIKFSPQGRFLMLGGFGNLSGNMSFWDVHKKELLGQCCAASSVEHEWAPNGRIFITARLFPRRRVENGFKIWRYNGDLLYSADFDELYQFSIRPAIAGIYPDRPRSPNVKPIKPGSSAGKPKAYVPPHLRKRQQRSSTNVKAMLRGRNQSALTGPTYSPRELRRREEEKKEKRERRKQKKKAKQDERKRQEELKKQEEEQKKQNPNQQPKEVDMSSLESVTKAIRRERKKLRQITALREKMKDVEISEQQRVKLATEPAVNARLAKLLEVQKTIS